jgi:hypothetical protein
VRAGIWSRPIDRVNREHMQTALQHLGSVLLSSVCFLVIACLANASTFRKEEVRSSETSVDSKFLPDYTVLHPRR